VLGLLLMLLRVLIDCCRVRQDLALENLVLRYQLEVMLRRKPKPCLRNRDRILLVWLRWLWPEGWTRQLRIVQPETVIGWHRSGWRLYRTWRSRTRLGRPRLTAEVRELIARMSQVNRLWGTELNPGVGGAGAESANVGRCRRQSSDSRPSSSRVRQGGMTDALLPPYSRPDRSLGAS
jgi:hypothetical protein